LAKETTRDFEAARNSNMYLSCITVNNACKQMFVSIVI